MSPYNLSPKAVERWTNELDKLLAGEEVVFRSSAPQKLAYRLREAIASAKRHDIAPYDSIDYMFKIEGESVVAVPKDNLVQDAQPREHVYAKVKNEFDVISLAAKEPKHVMVFPAFDGDLTAVKQWASAKDYTVTEDPLTLRKKP